MSLRCVLFSVYIIFKSYHHIIPITSTAKTTQYKPCPKVKSSCCTQTAYYIVPRYAFVLTLFPGKKVKKRLCYKIIFTKWLLPLLYFFYCYASFFYSLKYHAVFQPQIEFTTTSVVEHTCTTEKWHYFQTLSTF